MTIMNAEKSCWKNVFEQQTNSLDRNITATLVKCAWNDEAILGAKVL